MSTHNIAPKHGYDAPGDRMTINPNSGSLPQSTPSGPHCPHDDCSWGPCDLSGYVEQPCQTEGCGLCGAPSVATPEHWGGNPFWFVDLSAAEQGRVREYWDRYPLVRRAGDADEVIAFERRSAAHH